MCGGVFQKLPSSTVQIRAATNGQINRKLLQDVATLLSWKTIASTTIRCFQCPSSQRLSLVKKPTLGEKSPQEGADPVTERMLTAVARLRMRGETYLNCQNYTMCYRQRAGQVLVILHHSTSVPSTPDLHRPGPSQT